MYTNLIISNNQCRINPMPTRNGGPFNPSPLPLPFPFLPFSSIRPPFSPLEVGPLKYS